MNKKGFTLVELLATIVILAVLSLVAIPIVNKTIESSEKASFKQTATSILNAVKLERENNNVSFSEEVSNYKITPEGITYNDESINIKYKGEITGDGFVNVNNTDNLGEMEIEYTNGKWCAFKFYEDNTVYVKEGDCEGKEDFLCKDFKVEISDKDSWTQFKTLTITNSKNCTSYYKINDGSYIKYDQPVNITDHTARLTVKSVSGANVEKVLTPEILKIDRTAPEKADFSVAKKTTKSIQVVASSDDDKESGVASYAFSMDGGKTWTDFKKSNIYTFRDLKTNTYSIAVKVYNGTFDTRGADEKLGTVTSAVKNITIDACPTPTYTINPKGWAQQKTITINFGETEGCMGSYSINQGEWIPVKGKEITLPNNENGVVFVGKNTDEINTVIASSYTETKIDKTIPETISFTTSKTTKSITVTASASDAQSGILMYSFSKDGGINWTEYISSNVYTFDNLITGTYKIMVKAYNGTYDTKGAKEELGAKISGATNITLASCPTPTYSIDNTDWAQQKTVTINYGNMAGCTGSYSLDGGSTWKSGTSVTVTTNNQNVVAKNTDGTNTVTASTYTVTSIDRTAPDSVTLTTSKTTKSITVTATASDAQSGIERYAFSKDGGSTWTGWQTSNIYVFDNLKTGTYRIAVKAYNGTYNTNNASDSLGAKTSSVSSVTLNSCATPTYSVNPAANTWSQQKTVTINYGSVSGCTGSYSTDGGSNWISGTSVTITTNGGTVIAKNTDGTNTVTASTYTVINIDRTAPSVTLSTSKTVKTITVTASASDAQSGIARYAFSADGGSTWTGWQTSNVYTFSNLIAQTSYNIRVRAYNGTYGSTSASDSLGMATSAITPITTNSCPTPTFSVSPSGDVWATSKTVTITYPASSECTTKKYSTNGGSSWTTLAASTTQSTQAVTFTANGTLTAFQGMTTSVGSTTSQAVTKIDTTSPTVSIKAVKSSAGTAVSSGSWSNQTLKFTLTKGTTGSSGYTIKYCVDTANTCTPNTAIASGTAFTRTNTGTYYVRYNITSGAGKVSGTGSYTAKVDTTSPTVSIKAVKSSAGTAVSSGVSSNETLKFTLTKGTSGLSGTTIKYCVDTANTCTPSTVATSGTAFTRSEKGTYYVRYNITSGAGNVSATGSYTAKVYTDPPTISLSILNSSSTAISDGGTISGNAILSMTCDTNGSAVSHFDIEVQKKDVYSSYTSVGTFTTTPSSPYNYTYDNMAWNYTLDPSSYASSGTTLKVIVSCTDENGLTSGTTEKTFTYSGSSSSGSSSSGSSSGSSSSCYCSTSVSGTTHSDCPSTCTTTCNGVITTFTGLHGSTCKGGTCTCSYG